MATLSEFPFKATSSDRLSYSLLNEMADFFAIQTIHQYLNDILINGSSSVRQLPSSFTYTNTLTQTSLSYVSDTSTCLYDERGLVAFCDVLDLHDDASINTNIWSTSTTGAGSVAESSGQLSCVVSFSGSNSGTASAITNNASGLNIGGDNAEIIIGYELAGSGGASANGSAIIQLSDGTNHANLISVAVNGGVVSGDPGIGIVRIVYRDSDETVSVWKIVDGVETSLLTNSSISSLGVNKYIRLIANIGATSGSTNATVRCRAIGYRKNGASAGDATFVNANQTISSSDVFIFVPYWINTPSSSPSCVVSVNGGSNYGSNNVYNTWNRASSSGTNLMFKLSVAKPITITGNTKNIPILFAWGALFGDG